MKILNFLPIFITAVGIYFLFKLRFFLFLNPKGILNKLKADGKGSLSSLTLALAGTLGVGNIVGVAVGISVGGAGSVFWLLVSAVFAAVIKFCEAVISTDKGRGRGMIGVVRDSFGRASRLLAAVYAFLILLLCCSMGSMLQSASIGQSASYALGVNPTVSAFFVLLSLLPAAILGAQRMEKITVIVIPVATAVYTLLAALTIILNIDRLPSAFRLVFSTAFRFESGVGGILGFLSSRQIKEGYLRGLVSNEAGAGTSSLAHAKNPATDAGSVGVMGMCEIFFDTVLLCMLTAFATLVTLPEQNGLCGMEAVMLGIGSVFGGFSRITVALCIFFFAYSTIVCWYYYGSLAFSYLFGRESIVFTVAFSVFVFSGALVRGDILITVSDTVLFFLSLISLSALIINSDRIMCLSESCGLIKIKKRCRERFSSTRRKYIRGDQPKHR